MLPEVQPGSSIMPGKVNPVITESVIQVVAQVIGNDAAVAVAGQGGYFELNMMFPVAAHNILQATTLLASSARNFSRQCVTGLVATSAGPDLVEKGLMLARPSRRPSATTRPPPSRRPPPPTAAPSGRSPESSPACPKRSSTRSSNPTR